MFIGERGSDHRGLKSIEDQVSTDIRDVIQASNSDLMARGVAIDLIQAAKRVGPQYEAAEHKDLSGEKDFSRNDAIAGDWRGIEPYGDGTMELSMKALMSVSKPADLG